MPARRMPLYELPDMTRADRETYAGQVSALVRVLWHRAWPRGITRKGGSSARDRRTAGKAPEHAIGHRRRAEGRDAGSAGLRRTRETAEKRVPALAQLRLSSRRMPRARSRPARCPGAPRGTCSQPTAGPGRRRRRPRGRRSRSSRGVAALPGRALRAPPPSGDHRSRSGRRHRAGPRGLNQSLHRVESPERGPGESEAHQAGRAAPLALHLLLTLTC